MEEYSEINKYALIIGINEYKSGRDKFYKNLKGCVNDAVIWQQILIKYGFIQNNITLLVTPETTTKEKIKHEIKTLCSKLKNENDLGVIVFSGHGRT